MPLFSLVLLQIAVAGQSNGGGGGGGDFLVDSFDLGFLAGT